MADPSRTFEHIRTRTGAELGEYLRLVAARATEQIALRRGAGLGLVVGCGFPKSGTVWLCQLLGTALGLPYPREYRSPIVMAAVVHAHWDYDDRLPPTAYIRRDGRDVMVSLYFHAVRSLKAPVETRRGRRYRQLFEHLYGPDFNADDVRANLPRFLESQLGGTPGSGGASWAQHVADWYLRPGVAQISFEKLLSDGPAELARLMAELGWEPDTRLAELAVDRWSMATQTRREQGVEDRSSFLRRGTSGDWANHFSVESGEVFDHYAGEMLAELGYVRDRRWHETL